MAQRRKHKDSQANEQAIHSECFVAMMMDPLLKCEAFSECCIVFVDIADGPRRTSSSS